MDTTFTYASDDLQIMYSPGREALGEYRKWTGPNEHSRHVGEDLIRGEARWHFMGWPYEGNVRNHDDAVRLTREYVGMVK